MFVFALLYCYQLILSSFLQYLHEFFRLLVFYGFDFIQIISLIVTVLNFRLDLVLIFFVLVIDVFKLQLYLFFGLGQFLKYFRLQLNTFVDRASILDLQVYLQEETLFFVSAIDTLETFDFGFEFIGPFEISFLFLKKVSFPILLELHLLCLDAFKSVF